MCGSTAASVPTPADTAIAPRRRGRTASASGAVRRNPSRRRDVYFVNTAHGHAPDDAQRLRAVLATTPDRSI
jgi:hypothetical protein